MTLSAASPPVYPERDVKLADLMCGVIGIVEATRFEEHCLWRDSDTRSATSHGEWVESGWGLLQTVGWLDSRPICISLGTATVGGHKVLFWHATSQVVDYVLIDRWFEEMLPQSARRPDGLPNRTDAMNFHNVFPNGGAGGDPRPASASDDARNMNKNPSIPDRKEPA